MAALLTGGWRALADLRSGGWIRAIGAGLNDAGTMLRFLEATDLDFFLLAMRYTLLEHDTLEVELPRSVEKGVGLVIGGVFNSGITATGAVPGAYYNYAPATPEIMQRVSRIEAVCVRHGVPLPAAALQFPLGHPAVAAVIPGALDAAQVAANIAHVRHQIPPSLWEELKAERLIRADAPTPVTIA
jgi:D-threo-aldose 1-dehydrogenase